MAVPTAELNVEVSLCMYMHDTWRVWGKSKAEHYDQWAMAHDIVI